MYKPAGMQQVICEAAVVVDAWDPLSALGVEVIIFKVWRWPNQLELQNSHKSLTNATYGK